MPNSLTFRIQPIKNIIVKYSKGIVVDAFANDGIIKYSLKGCEYISNDLNERFETDYHLKAIDFYKTFKDSSVDTVLYDPPYSPRQVKEVYEGIGIDLFKEDTQMSFWSRHKNEIARITKVGGFCISLGWGTNGMGKNRGFEIVEILLVAHGGSKNDTIVTVEKKNHYQERLF